MDNILKRSRSIYFFLLIGFISITGCLKDEPVTIPKGNDTNLVFESFVFETENNPHLSEDIVFNVTDNTISGELKNYFFYSTPTFSTNAATVEINSEKQTSASTPVDFRKAITYTLKSESGTANEYTVDISWDDALAHIYIDTEGGAPIVSKEEYVYTKLTIDGQSKYDDRVFELSDLARIKGRGNSTWIWPKKPYKIKLDTKESLFGLLPEKDWVLLADYQDDTHLLHAVAFKIGRLLEMPFTNTIVPVEVTLNGDYLGLYGLTEQIEVKTNRVNVGDDDGLLLELDQYFDEEWQFKSAAYDLPVMVKDPELATAAELALIQSDFEAFEALVASADFPNNNYLEYIDDVSIANYFIVYMLTANEEINHPKSTYMHKSATGKYTMGPIWDFDWAYGFEGTGRHFSNPEKPLFWSPPAVGTNFFSRLMSDPKIELLMKDQWRDFKADHLSELMDYIDEHAFIIEGAKARNVVLWNNNLETDVEVMKTWIEIRVSYMDAFMNSN
ncbi:MAG: CotH kinase family protein [Maribacter sp.]|nr:CotH kinase family protein [Maribacter sp.]